MQDTIPCKVVESAALLEDKKVAVPPRIHSSNTDSKVLLSKKYYCETFTTFLKDT